MGKKAWVLEEKGSVGLGLTREDVMRKSERRRKRRREEAGETQWRRRVSAASCTIVWKTFAEGEVS